MPIPCSRSSAKQAARWAGLWLLPFLGLSAQTLQEQVDLAVGAFGEGNYTQAYWTFENIELDYGQEPDFLDASFQGTVLPVRAYAALMAERPTDALIFFDQLLR